MSGASAADVRSILSIPDPSTSQPPSASTSTPTTATAPKQRRAPKPDGISRELYALIGSSVPTLTAQLSKPKYKPKPKNFAGGGRATKWSVFHILLLLLAPLTYSVRIELIQGMEGFFESFTF